MSYLMTHADDVPAGGGPHPAGSPFDKRVSDRLGLAAFKMYQVELPPGASTVPHDHLQDGVEDAYAIVRGGGWLVVDDERVPVGAGHFVAVTKESSRSIVAGAHGCVLIAVCG